MVPRSVDSSGPWRRVRRRRFVRAGFAWALWTAGVIAIVFGAVGSQEGRWAVASLIPGGLAFGAVGLVLALRALTTGWLFLGIQLSAGLSLGGRSHDLFLILVAAVLATFPSGRLPSARWRWTAYLLLVGSGSWVALDLLQIGGRLADDLGWLLSLISVGPVLVASAGRIALDALRSRDDTRQQLKWLAAVLVIGGVLLLLSLIPLPVVGDAHQLAGVVLMVGSPVAVGLAVTKYRLYDIDLVISRTLTYTVLILVLGLVYGGMVGIVSIQFTGSLPVATSTLTVAGAFNPLRRKLRQIIDRRFNRSGYDRERVINSFERSLQIQASPAGVVGACLDVVAATVQPTIAGMWVRNA